jgi:adenylate kinase
LTKKLYKEVPYSEEDFKMRHARPEYQKIKEIEEKIISINKPNLKTYVISAGVLYGKGEAIFNNHFKNAWL